MENQNKNSILRCDCTFIFANILNLKSGVYRGVNEEGQPVTVSRNEGKGFEINTSTQDGWHKVVGYDEDGLQEWISFGKNH